MTKTAAPAKGKSSPPPAGGVTQNGNAGAPVTPVVTPATSTETTTPAPPVATPVIPAAVVTETTPIPTKPSPAPAKADTGAVSLSAAAAAAAVKRPVPALGEDGKPTGEIELVDVAEDEVFAWTLRGDRVTVVTTDGQKLVGEL